MSCVEFSDAAGFRTSFSVMLILKKTAVAKRPVHGPGSQMQHLIGFPASSLTLCKTSKCMQSCHPFGPFLPCLSRPFPPMSFNRSPYGKQQRAAHHDSNRCSTGLCRSHQAAATCASSTRARFAGWKESTRLLATNKMTIGIVHRTRK